MTAKRTGGSRTIGKRRPARRPVTGQLAAFQRFVGEVFRLNGQLLATAEGMSRSIGISPARWQTIAVLRKEPLPIARIARRLGLRRQSVQHNVDRLVSQGLAELQPNPHHRRASMVALTAEGQAVMERLEVLQGRLTVLFIGRLGLTTEKLDALATTLQQIRLQADPEEGP